MPCFSGIRFSKGAGNRPEMGMRRITRRKALAGGGTLALAAAGAGIIGPKPAVAALFDTGAGCAGHHERIAAELDRIIADPAIGGERTALAMMEARCPACRCRVSPATAHPSAVLPKWRQAQPGENA